MRILGLSAYYHDSAAALVDDGVIVAAAQEERFSRKKHDRAFPQAATRYCLEAAGMRMDQVDRVVFFERPLLKFRRVMATWLGFAPAGRGTFVRVMSSWLTVKLHQRQELVAQLARFGPFDPARLEFTEHHLSHAASAFFPSPFEEAAILVVDGVGEFATTTIGAGRGNQIVLNKQLNFPHSIGLLYAAITAYLGFKVNSGEYKVMGLAPYGRPTQVEKIMDHLVHLKPDGSFRLDQRYFGYCTGATMTNARFDALFGAPRREPESELTQRHFDMAASIQQATEQILLSITRAMARDDTTGNLCLAGGVALNCVANRKILDSSGFKNIWVQPASGDAGNALGAALVGHHMHDGRPRSAAPQRDTMQGSQLGPAFTQAECEARLRQAGAVFTVHDDAALMERSAALLANGQVMGWFQGRMEFGPRALGNRSILADARIVDMQLKMNLKIKFRESFRPFAPAVLSEDADAWFELPTPSPYMLLVANLRPEHRLACADAADAAPGTGALNLPRSSVPAITHVDNSARVQTVDAGTTPRFHALLTEFKRRTGCPILINTSFNVRGEPIVCTPEDAFSCFMATGIDALAVGNCLLVKSEQTASGTERPAFDPD
ncbi:MAG: carbamoyltransferase [Vitreoscilla sp.]|nr:carbamoyltransferase [Vitreoscilla sp.]